MRITSVIVTMVLLGTAAAGYADGLLYQLPADGTWAEYELSLVTTQGDKKRDHSGYLRVSSVGKVTHNGQECRWIEMTVSKAVPPLPEETIKLLIPEQRLRAGENIVEHIVRGYRRRGDKPAEEFMDGKKISFQIGPLTIFLHGPIKDVQKGGNEEVAIEGLGKLSCLQETGKSALPFRDGTVPVDFTVCRHDKAPFGAVRMQFRMVINQAESAFQARMVKTGTGAKSALPDSR